MEWFQKNVIELIIAALGGAGTWIFNLQHKRISSLEETVAQNSQNIALNTQSDKEYRENMDKTLNRVEGEVKEMHGMLATFLKDYGFVLDKLKQKEMDK